MNETIVTLGAHEVPVYPQRHAYLTNRFGAWFKTLSGADVPEGDILGFVTKNAYEVLGVLIPTIPKRIPRWEWDGFASAVAAAAGEYVEEDDKSPTTPEMIEAFQIAIKVNRFDAFQGLMKMVDPQLLRGWINAQLAEQMTSPELQNLPSPNGESDQMSFGATTPTQMVSVD